MMRSNDAKDLPKLTLEEYVQKYSRRENTRFTRSFLRILEAALGLVIAATLLFVVLRLFELHRIAGYIGIALAIAFFVFCYVIPVIRIKQIKAFDVNVNQNNARAAQRHNKRLRQEIADKIIDFSESTDGIGWYSTELVGKLAVARHNNNEDELKKVLSQLYDVDIKKTANSIIKEHAFKVGVVTAISQSEKIDTMFVSVYELGLIKQLVFLYGFRPSDAKLVRIYSAVVRNALIAYGLESVVSQLTTGVVKKIGGIVNSIPLLGTAVATVIGSASQGVINGGMTVIIGHQTLKYLQQEYHLQDLLDNVNLDDDIDEKEMMLEVKDDILKETRNQRIHNNETNSKSDH